MQENTLALLLDFFNIVANLKTVYRQGWVDKLKMEKPESVSDHTFLMSIMAMIFSDIQKLDTLRVLKMSLLHDLSESYTGDLTPNQISKKEKNSLEKETMIKIINNLPDEIKDEFINLWDEFQQNKSPESKLVHEIDKLEMALQAKIYEKEGFKEIKPFLESAEKQIQNKQLKELFTKIINQ
jgi:putative hydrolase of HD superfamily